MRLSGHTKGSILFIPDSDYFLKNMGQDKKKLKKSLKKRNKKKKKITDGMDRTIGVEFQ